MREIYDLQIFSGIEKNEIDDLIKNLRKEIYKSGEIIIRQGDESNGKGYIILSGKVSVEISGEKIASLDAGNIFGEIALLNEEERTATIIAETDLELLILSQETILEIMNQDNYLNKEIMRRVQENLENNR
ncbi:MAG: cyclic nucleotide-binding domain-containing protein [Candidatus Gracilibacteria bacterium]|nr:cyclic nucleotide-binding domain-containing protein [Candidatus Gracilibacteria bacterium]